MTNTTTRRGFLKTGAALLGAFFGACGRHTEPVSEAAPMVEVRPYASFYIDSGRPKPAGDLKNMIDKESSERIVVIAFHNDNAPKFLSSLI